MDGTMPAGYVSAGRSHVATRDCCGDSTCYLGRRCGITVEMFERLGYIVPSGYHSGTSPRYSDSDEERALLDSGGENTAPAPQRKRKRNNVH